MSTQGQWRGEVDGLWFGPVEAGDPGIVNLSATLTGSGALSGALTALVATPAENPRYSQAERDHAHWRQLREEDDVLLALLQQFVMEEA